MRTPSQTVGPFFAIGLPHRPLAPDGVELTGRLLDGQGEPMPDGVVEVLDPVSGAWGRSGTDADGRFRFVVPREATRLEAFVFARGLLRHQLTRVYFPDEAAANAADPVLSSLDPADRATLVAAADGDGLRFDIRMQGDSQTVFFA